MKNTELWTKIEAFGLDKPDVARPFSARLSEENHWDLDTTKRVILEYKKFIYLACISEEPVSPSKAVDLAWHLHLTFTRSYWDKFCRDTLGKAVHHEPSTGSVEESDSLRAAYARTLSLLEEEFAAGPDPTIWPPQPAGGSEPEYRIRKHIAHFLGGVTISMIAALCAFAAGIPLGPALGMAFVGTLGAALLTLPTSGKAKDSASACGGPCGSGCSGGCGD